MDQFKNVFSIRFQKEFKNQVMLQKKNKYQDQKLPMIERPQRFKNNKTHTFYEKANQRLSVIRSQKSNSISKILGQVRLTMKNQLYNDQSLQKQRKNYENGQKRMQKIIHRKQKKLYYYSKTSKKQNQLGSHENLFKLTRAFQNVQVQQIQTNEKPPHRYKTAICHDNDKLYLYGGIGCENNLKLAEFDLKKQKWTFPQENQFLKYRPTIPITGHSFTCHKGKGYIYGGSSTDITNELSIVNLTDYKFQQGSTCQYRRKDHAVVMISKYMIVQGGIQSSQTMNNMYFYDTQLNVWGDFMRGSIELPYLSHHAMASTFSSKTKKKVNSLADISDSIFIFGGKNKKGNASNSLYKIQIDNDSVRVQKVNFSFSPLPRFSSCFHYVGNNMILLYGGKQTRSEQNQNEEQFNDIFSLNTQKFEWVKQKTNELLPPRYGMASVANLGKIYFFGGFVENKYSNANITILTSLNPQMLKSKSNLGRKSILSGEQYCEK